MFDEFKRSGGQYVAEHTVTYALGAALFMAVLGTAVFRNVFAGLAGGLATGLFTLWWWRANGPGRKRLEKMSREAQQPNKTLSDRPGETS